MGAINAAVNFGKDMIELSVSTLATLVSVQLADLTTFFKRQSDAIARTGDVRDGAALMALQREYREAFWTDRRKTLADATGALQVASRRAAKSWAAWVGERGSPAVIESKPPNQTVARAPAAIAAVPIAKPKPRGDDDAKIHRSRRSKIAKEPSKPTKARVSATRSTVRKRSVRTKHPPPTTH